ncbi:MAG: hypothetical protein AAFV53_14065 [Myxococcota bacterium]
MHDRHLSDLLLTELREMLDQERERAYRKQEGEWLASRQDDLIRKNFAQAEQLSQLEDATQQRTARDQRFRMLAASAGVGMLVGALALTTLYVTVLSERIQGDARDAATAAVFQSLDAAAPLTAAAPEAETHHLASILGAAQNLPITAGCLCVRPQDAARVSSYEWCVLTDTAAASGCSAEIAARCESHYDFVGCMDPFSANVNVLLGSMQTLPQAGGHPEPAPLADGDEVVAAN